MGVLAMKFSVLMGLSFFLTAATASAFDATCKATAIYDDSFLEESLSIEEYPDIVVSSSEVSLGSSVFSNDDEYVIQALPAVGFSKALEIAHKNGSVKYILQINDSPLDKTGTLWGENRGGARSKIADLDCR